MGFQIWRERELRALCLLIALPWAWVSDARTDLALSGLWANKQGLQSMNHALK